MSDSSQMPRGNSCNRTPRDMPGNSSREYLESGMSSSTVLKGHICQECGKDFKFKSKLKQHSAVHSGEKLFVCNICKRSYTQEASLYKHKRIHHPETFQMSIENSSFKTTRDTPKNSSREDLEPDLDSCSELKSHVCQECGKDFKFKSNLKQHSAVHSGEKPFVCNICKRSYTRKAGLNEHKRIHHPETFQMSKSSSTFKNSSDTSRNSSREDLECEVASSLELKGHVCEENNKNFISKSNLKTHSAVIIGEKPFVCDICPKSYYKNYNLIKHKKIHHPETFQMPRTNSSFKKSSDMHKNSSREDFESEVASCSELKGYICQECGKDFKFKSKLKQHSVVHSRKKSFACDVCQKPYSRKDHLKRHKKNHHPETFQM